MMDPPYSDCDLAPCKCGHAAKDHCYSDGTFKPDCDQCPCKAFQPEAQRPL
jgi:hypothetical protein